SVSQVGVGTVESFSRERNEATLAMDDGGEAWASSLVGVLTRGDRVVVGYKPPRGMFVMGRLFGELTEPGAVTQDYTYATYVPITRHGGAAGEDITVALVNAFAEAAEIGAAGVLL